MSQFGSIYSKYYDLLYHDKDYFGEVEYIEFLIKKNSSKIETILDLGCGTGKHDELLCNKGFRVHGVDLSQEMLEIANQRRKNKEEKLTFSHSDIASLSLNQKFDAVLSLFHVMSYQITNRTLDKVFSSVRSHLKDRGLFVFDFWYGPAVLSDLPKVTTKNLENQNIKLTRKAKPQIHAQQNKVDVFFDILIKNKIDNTIIKKKELHQMRYFFDTELEMLCEKHGFDIKEKFKWLSTDKPGFKTWNVVWVVIKRS